MLKLSTINQIVEAILGESENCSPGNCETVANEAVIYYKTAMICEDKGIEEAMKYFTGTHDTDEYQEFRTSIVIDPTISLCKNCNCMTRTSNKHCCKCWCLKEVEDES